MKLNGFWKVLMASGASLMVIVAAAPVTKLFRDLPTVTVYRSPT